MIRLASIAITSCLTMLIAGCGDKPRTDIAADSTRHTGPAVSEGLVNAGDSVQLFYRMVGSGPDTIIVLHGGPGFTADYLAADLEPLAERHTLFFYDQRGTGKSTLVTDSAALAGPRFAEDVEAIRVHFGMDRVILLGHSWGSGVAALYGERFPERVGKLILVGSMPLTRKGLTDAFEELASSRDSAETRRMEEAMAARQADPGNKDHCLAYYRIWFRRFFADSTALDRSKGDFCAGTPESRRNKIASVDKYTFASLGDYDWRTVLPAVTAPTLIIHGSKDVLPLEGAREYARGLQDSRLLVLDGIGHFSYVEAPDRFFAAVNEFLAGGWPEGAEVVNE
jgi:proline iminopeptidase